MSVNKKKTYWVVYNRGGMSKEDTIETWEKEKDLVFREVTPRGNLIFTKKNAND